ncbi:MAG: ABC transporter permease, partial [Eggerthella sp.]|nr:ABC transporter permease [Eggerthella sp.]
YSLVVSFANLGKAIAVFLLIIQVTSGGGSFPLQMLPDFLQVLSPFLPATHVINAMRAAMMGVYMNDFWIEIGLLLLFVVPFLLLGLVFRKPLMRFLNWYIEKVEESKLVC